MQKVYLALGSNLCNPVRQVIIAAQHICSLPYVQNFQSSSLYLTHPLNVNGPEFINSVVCFDIPSISWEKCFSDLVNIEKIMGKVDKPKNASRVIDIDILFWSDEMISDIITVPHPRWKERLFVLEPLAELIDEIILPINQTSVNIHSLIEELKVAQENAGYVIEKMDLEVLKENSCKISL